MRFDLTQKEIPTDGSQTSKKDRNSYCRYLGNSLLGLLLRSVRQLRFFRAFCLVADLAGAFESGGDTKLGQYIKLEQEPHEKNPHYKKYFSHCLFLQPTAETIYAQEKPLEDVLHEDVEKLPLSEDALPEEKVDSRRSGLDAPHCGHLIAS